MLAAADKRLGDFLEEWIQVAKMRLRYSTYIGYRTNLRRHVLPELGDLALEDVSPHDLNTLYAHLLKGGRCDGKGGLSNRTVQYTHTVLKRALADAVRWGLIERNPADGADPPARRTPEMKTWSAEQVRAFLDHVRGDRLYPMWLLATTTGLRRGEVLGLKWPCVDLQAGRLKIRQTYVAIGNHTYWSEPKTKGSRRQIVLPAQAAQALAEWRDAQRLESVFWPKGFADTDVVFTQPHGEPVHPDRITRAFAKLSKQAGLPHIRLHDLRHTFATVALEAGVHAKVVSEMLGHSSIMITLDTYSHVMPVMHEEAMGEVASRLLGETNNRPPGG